MRNPRLARAIFLVALSLCGWRAHAQPVEFIRGDTNSDGKVDISDGINTLATQQATGWKDGLAALFHIIRFRFFDRT